MPVRPWSESARFLATLAVLAALLGITFALRPVAPAIGAAALAAFLLNPFVHLFRRRLRLGRVWAARLTYLIFLLLIVNIPAWLGALVVNRFGELVTLVASWVGSLALALSRPIVLLGRRFDPAPLLDSLEQALRRAWETIPDSSFTVLSSVSASLLWTLVALILTYYLLKDGPALKRWLVRAAPPAEQDAFARLLEEVDLIWSRFLRVQVVMFTALSLAIILGSLLVIWVWQTGVIGRSPLGLIVGLVAVYTLLQQLDNLWLRPHFLGRSLQLHPGVVFVGLVAGLLAGGLLGFLFAVPLIATARVAGAYLRERILVSPTPPAPAARLHAGTPAPAPVNGGRGIPEPPA
jgi:predicted PurR-regulated permease PerM